MIFSIYVRQDCFKIMVRLRCLISTFLTSLSCSSPLYNLQIYQNLTLTIWKHYYYLLLLPYFEKQKSSIIFRILIQQNLKAHSHFSSVIIMLVCFNLMIVACYFNILFINLLNFQLFLESYLPLKLIQLNWCPKTLNYSFYLIVVIQSQKYLLFH
jgi:hypothetical protein